MKTPSPFIFDFGGLNWGIGISQNRTCFREFYGTSTLENIPPYSVHRVSESRSVGNTVRVQ
eukprot:8837724-Pyramimonas_sp.AAC.1